MRSIDNLLAVMLQNEPPLYNNSDLNLHDKETPKQFSEMYKKIFEERNKIMAA